MGKLALIFPGQGSQTVGMGRELSEAYEVAATIYDRATDELGWDVAALSFDGPSEKLSLTEFAQVALYTNSVAAMAALSQEGISGEALSGHSLGEYSALAASGAVSFEQGLRLVAARGKAMSQAAAERPGAMAAIIGLDDPRIEEICSQSGEVWPVNYNCPGQLVISGETDAVLLAMASAERAGARKTVRLAVSGSFHSPLMRSAAGRMKEELAVVEFKDPQPPFLSPTSCEYEAGAGIGDLLVRQIVSPVLWHQAVDRLSADGFDRFLEVGSGKVLSGLIRRIDKSVKTGSFSGPGDLEKALTLA